MCAHVSIERIEKPKFVFSLIFFSLSTRVHACMHVCVHVCMCACACMHAWIMFSLIFFSLNPCPSLHACKHVCTYLLHMRKDYPCVDTCTHTNTHVGILILHKPVNHTYTAIHTHIQPYAHTYTAIHTHIYSHTHPHIHTLITCISL
jgi:hypothetical protein